jgi:hypothetical protein
VLSATACSEISHLSEFEAIKQTTSSPIWGKRPLKRRRRLIADSPKWGMTRARVAANLPTSGIAWIKG